ncbi:MAG: alpha/beta fold hydrolase [Planctomycetia bacterium]|nr:alpha/beta fold hydrolase [Planctomycetia bacterium]
MRDWHDLYPYSFKEIFIQNLRYHYVDEGIGAPLLMVHGNPTWSFYWRNLIDAFKGNYRVVAPDHIGCGLSAMPSKKEYPFTLQRRIDDLVELILKLDLKDITLIAHDWGGAIGLGAAQRVPERFARFVLCNTGAFRFNRCPWRIRVCRVPIFGDIAIKGFNAFARGAVRMATCRRERMTREVRGGLLAPYNSWRNRTATHEFVRDIPLSKKDRSYETLVRIENDLAKFRNHPVCLIWGMKDWCFTPEFMERFQYFFPQAEIYPFNDAGHYVVEDAFERMIPIIDDFIKKG